MGDSQQCVALLEKLHHLHRCRTQQGTKRRHKLLQGAAAR